MKDIFIDNNVTKNFVNPSDQHYKDLIKWIMDYNIEEIQNNSKSKHDFAHLVVNNKLLVEYNRSSYNCKHSTSIPMIISKLTKEGRLIKINNETIKEVEVLHLTKAIKRRILSNIEDHCHICSVILSNRKMVLTYDINLIKDLTTVIGKKLIISSRPESLNYDQ